MAGAIIMGIVIFLPLLVIAFLIMRVDLLLHFLHRDDEDPPE